MPELAEVEYGRKVAESVARGRRITEVWCAEDNIVFDGVTGAAVREALVNRRVEAVHRRGKYLWFELDRPPCPIFHFGMTGAFHSPGVTLLQLEASPVGGEQVWPPRFEKIRITFDDGGQLAMTNKRRLGRIRLREDPLHEAPISRLGFDVLINMPQREEFAALLRGRKAVLKGLLLNQSFAAGVGNWLADEFCYHAGIAPHRRAADLSADEVERLRLAMVDIVHRAASVDADKSRFPPEWLFHRRWGRPEGSTTHDGHPIVITTLAGRSTAWVPEVQV